MANKLTKCIACLLAAVMLVLPQAVFAQTAEELEFNYNAVENIATVSGMHPGGAGARVTVVVDCNGTPFFRREITAGADGIFNVTFELDGGTEDTIIDQSGRYTAKVGGTALTAESVSYQFVNNHDGKQIVIDANAAQTEAEMRQVLLVDYTAALDLKVGEGSDYAALGASQSKVMTALAEKDDYTSAPGVITAFDTAVAIQTLNDAPESEGQALIQKYANLLEINYTDGSKFALLNNEESKTFVFGAMTGKDFSPTDVQSVRDEFLRMSYTALFNEIDNATLDNFMVYVSECNDENIITFPMTDYNSSSLTDVDRANIIKAVVAEKNNQSFSDLNGVVTAFNTASQEAVEEASKDTDSQGGNHGGGGGGGSVKVETGYKPQDKEPVYDQKPDDSVSEDKPVQSQQGFGDMNNHWAKEAVDYMAGRNIIAGMGDGTFLPDKDVMREEFVKMLVLALNIPAEETQKSFTDITEDMWCYEYVMRAYATNIVKGVDFDIFGTGQPITREQMCTFIYRAAKLMDINIEDNGKEIVFKDIDNVSAYAREAVESLYRAGIINGVSEDYIEPQGTAARAMAAQMLYNIIKGGNAA